MNAEIKECIEMCKEEFFAIAFEVICGEYPTPARTARIYELADMMSKVINGELTKKELEILLKKEPNT